MRLAIATLVVSLASLAHADSPSAPPAPPAPTNPAAKPPVKPDEVADVESREANLEANDPRSGLTFTFAPGGGTMIGNGVGRGFALSIRLGEVATRRTVITFEFAGTNALHRQSTDGPVLQDSNFGLFAGAQTYRTSYLWLRGAGGLTFLVRNAMKDGTGGEQPLTGVGGIAGIGFDLLRSGYFVAGLEAMGLASVSSDGFKVQIGVQLNLSHY